MKKIILIFFILSSITIKAQTFIKSFTFEGVVRNYRVFIPSGYNQTNAHPLVFNLHGNGSTASQQEAYSEMNLIADTANFIVVYPDGVSNTWNSGFNTPYNSGINDVGFISDLIDTVASNYNIDLQRVYSCGMSMGGFMSYRLACELHERIAAIASVTGLMSYQLPQNCQQQKEVPVMQIHGTDDSTVLYNGTSWHTSVSYTMDYWIQKNNCPTLPIITNIPDTVNEGSTVQKFYYGPCDNNSEVILFRVDSGGHTWPGAIPITSLGNTNQDINASIEIWKFFSNHKLDLANSVYDLEPQENNLVNILPNPVTDRLTINYQETKKEKKLTVLNFTGTIIHSETIAPSVNSTSVDFTSYPNGLYFVVVRIGETINATKVIKN